MGNKNSSIKKKFILGFVIVLVLALVYIFTGSKDTNNVSEDKEDQQLTATPDLIQTQNPTEKAEELTPSEPEVQYCFISIDCKQALLNSDNLNPALLEELPSDGVIVSKNSVVLYDDDTVFDVLKRIAEEKNIALEYSVTPANGSVYIEGIAELYQFDCGNLSGWMYTVNGETASVAASEYKLKNNDKINWIYTCSLGNDIQ